MADVNVWVAIAFRNHIHHTAAKDWFDGCPAASLTDLRVVFDIEPEGLDHQWRRLTSGEKALTSGWTDAYLAAFAIERAHCVVTFDKGFRRFPLLDLTLLEA